LKILKRRNKPVPVPLIVGEAIEAAKAGRTAEARRLVAGLRKIPDKTDDLRLALVLIDAWGGRPLLGVDDLAARLREVE
jgi:hypothetical protein